MALWNPSGQAPTDFYDILNDEDVENVVEGLEELEEEDLDAHLDEDLNGEYHDEDLDGEYHDEEAEVASEPAPVAPELSGILAMRDENLVPLPPRSPSTVSGSSTAAAGSSSSHVLMPFDVVVMASLMDDDIAMEQDHFSLADEHQLFQQEEVVEDVTADQPQQQRRPRRGGAWRGGAARRAGAARRGDSAQRGRRRGPGVPSGDPQWVRGERLIEVHVDDEDVPVDVRKKIMHIVRMREAARVQVTNSARRMREENEDEWADADDGEVEAFFSVEGTSNHFDWSPMGDFQGEKEQFLPQQTGAVVQSENAYEAFRQYWDDGIMSHIVTETNRYAARVAGSSVSFARDWYDTNIHELFVLFSFWMMLGVVRMPTLKSCFTVNPLLQANVFRKMFSRTRYENLCRVFNLNDTSSKPTDSTELLFSLGPILDHLNVRFKETYIPSQDICIDESLTLWKGNLSFRQYMKTKAARLGVKTFELCESSTGYLWSFFVYLGAGTSYGPGLSSGVLKSPFSVIRVIRPLLDQGYTLYMNNWFNSPLLARFLKSRKTDCVGPLRANRSNVPPLISLCSLKDGQFVARHSGDVVVLAFQDKKRKIATISTYHGSSQGQMVAKPYRQSLYKLQVVLDYNKTMGGVDRKDQMLEPYLLERKRSSKLNVKFFKHLLNCSILNARILLQSSSAAPIEHLVFRLQLVEQILQRHLEHVPKVTPTHPASSSLSFEQPQGLHFPQMTDVLPDGRHSRRRCLWCSQHKKRQRTMYVCSACEVPLCYDPCFQLYHA